MFAKKEEAGSRFVPDRKLPSGTQLYVLVDAQTGVNYLVTAFGTGVSVTPLLDRDGKPIVTAI